jgi:hypothetical protein
MRQEAAAAPPPAPSSADDSKPIPAEKPMPAGASSGPERELAAHKRRDPLFEPAMDASRMFKDLRRWFEKSRTS